MTKLRSFPLLLALPSAAEWVIDDSVTDLVLMGVGAADTNHGVAGTCSSTGAEPAYWNGTTWTFTHNSPAGVIMDTAALPDNAWVYSTFSGPFLSTDQGESWEHVSDAVGVSQSVQAFNGDSFALAGQFTTSANGTFGGVIMSTDKGKEWTSYPIEGAPYVRYGDYPSEMTWYVTEGSWPVTSSSPSFHAFPNLESGFELTSRVRVGNKDSEVVSSDGESHANVGYTANIYKTTDGGKSFSKVFASGPTDDFYFNAISCGSETSCVAVAEGEVVDGKVIHYTTFAFMTSDGGNNWDKVFDGGYNYMSLMSVKMTSEMEGWMGPSGFKQDSKTEVVTDFMYTSDKGATWILGQSLENCISSDIESAAGLTLSSCLTAGGLSSRVAFYEQTNTTAT